MMQTTNQSNEHSRDIIPCPPLAIKQTDGGEGLITNETKIKNRLSIDYHRLSPIFFQHVL